MTTSNPLQQYFRQPAIYVKLPSGGKFYPPGTIEMPANKELPVYPMTALDEITQRTADALFNGEATVKTIQSCVPNIKDAWAVPTIDMDTLLIAIRIASYGHELEFESACPSCSNENNYAVDLRILLEQLSAPDYNQTVNYGDIEIFLRPLNYKEQNLAAMEQFEDQKLMEMIPQSDISDKEKIELLSSAYLKLSELTIRSVSESIECIKINNETVTDREHISEFVRNADKKVFDAISKQLASNKLQSELKPLSITCSECGHGYDTPFTMDSATFFA